MVCPGTTRHSVSLQTKAQSIFSALSAVQNHRPIFPRLKWKRLNRMRALNQRGTSISTSRNASVSVAASGNVCSAAEMYSPGIKRRTFSFAIAVRIYSIQHAQKRRWRRSALASRDFHRRAHAVVFAQQCQTGSSDAYDVRGG